MPIILTGSENLREEYHQTSTAVIQISLLIHSSFYYFDMNCTSVIMSKVIRDIQDQLKVTRDGKARVDLMNQLVIESRDNDSTTSLAMSEEALDLATQLDYKRGIAYSTLNIGYLKDFQGQKEEALPLLEKALTLFEALDDKEAMGYAYKYLCWYYWGLGEMNKALKLMFNGLKLNEGTNTVIEGWALFVIGVFYSDMKNYPLSKDYLNKALEVFRPLDYEHGIGRTLNGLSAVYDKLGENEKALDFGLEALKIHQQANYQMGLARSYNDIGSINTKLERYPEAAEHLSKSLSIRRVAKNKQAVITTLTALGDVHFRQKAHQRALEYLEEAEALATEIDAKAKLIKIKQLLIAIYEALDQPWEALKHHKAYSVVNTELLSQDAESRIQSMEALLNEEKKERQKQRIEMLFGQQVSSEVVQALLDKEDNDDVKRSQATIMFLDIRNFTVFARGKDPTEVIRFQNNVFSPLIDIITQHHGIINQILGDGFMASFGIPMFEKDHCQNAFDAGLDIIKRMKELADEGRIPPTKVGIGLHTGEVTSGNIGNEIRKQFSIAGDTVIMAARLEQLNKQYQSQFLISKDVHDKVNPGKVILKSLGKLDLKGFEKVREVFQVN